MIPPYCSDDIRSSGEKQLFNIIKNDPETDGWICLHSLGLARHVKRLYGEIDFVVMVPGEGIFCLEVKSGSVSRKNGVWTYRNRYGEMNTSTVGPFRQAQEGMFSLIAAIRRKFGNEHHLSRLVYGYGVIFPHISFQIDDPEYEPWQIYDRNSRREPVSVFIKRLSRFTHAKVRNKKWYDTHKSRPSVSDIEILSGFLRGDFEVVIKPAEQMAQAELQLMRLTENQYRCLDGLQNNDRCLFQGGAGTGKTLLAIEFARREARAGRRVLVVCFNRFLGKWIAEEVGRTAPNASVFVDSFHRFLDSIIMRSGRKAEFKHLQKTRNQEEVFKEVYPLFALETISEGVIEQFDVIVVDEGQDLIRPEYLDVLDSLLKGGLAGGKWAIFCDFHGQSIYADLTHEEMLAEIDRRVSRYARFNLMVNCRNTRPIGEETALISGFPAPPFLPANVEGVPVEYRFFTDTENEREIIRGIINTLIGDGVTADLITILSPKIRRHSCLSAPLKDVSCPIEELNEKNIGNPRDGIATFSTIHAFKGLENSVIIIADVEHLMDNPHRSLFYVGMSRARQRLYVVAAESARDEYYDVVKRRIHQEVRQQ